MNANPYPAGAAALGFVVIGRNEAARLASALRSASASGGTVVYVDSGSTDASVDIARSAGVDVVDLDRTRPFTAARARNEGFLRLAELAPALELVQFLDGDCELAGGWIDAAAPLFAREPLLGGVCGRLVERHERATLYNRLCALDWRMLRPGEGAYCGVMLVRCDAFRAVGGFEGSMIAGEDPDLALRLARAGFHTRRIDVDMALHDAALVTFRQWWRRAMRTGHSNAELAWRHSALRARDRWRAIASALAWGLLLPLAILAAAVFATPWALVALSLYPVLWLRIFLRSRAVLGNGGDAALYSTGCLEAKTAAALGALRFALTLLRLRPRSTIIE